MLPFATWQLAGGTPLGLHIYANYLDSRSAPPPRRIYLNMHHLISTVRFSLVVQVLQMDDGDLLFVEWRTADPFTARLPRQHKLALTLLALLKYVNHS